MGVETNSNDNDKVWCTVETTVNLGNYENVKISMGESVTILSDEDAGVARRKLCDRLIKDLQKQKKIIRKDQEGEFNWR